MNSILTYSLIALLCLAIFRVLREAQSYRRSWNISWITALKYHMEWQRQITFIAGCLLLLTVVWSIVWLFATYGCSFLKGLAC